MLREKIYRDEISSYGKKCEAAFQNQMYSTADKYACYILNSYFRKVIYKDEEAIIVFLINCLFAVGNLKEAKKLKFLMEASPDSEIKSDSKLFLFDKCTPLIEYDVEEKVTSLYNYEIDHYSKYCRNFETNFIRSIQFFSNTISITNLKDKINGNILDIGSGYGFVSYIFKRNGYEVDTIDIEEKPESFTKALKFFGLTQKIFTVEKYKPLISFNKKFDLVFASQICFNGHATKDLWDVEEWKFFLKDLYENFLNDSGYVALSFNYEKIDSNKQPHKLGAESIEIFFKPYLHEKVFNWKVAVLSKKDLKKLIKD
jgi:SAM-dependent methyltransferase